MESQSDSRLGFLRGASVQRWHGRRAEPYSIQLGRSDKVADASWLMLPNYAPRATPFRSSQIRKHLALRLESSVIKNTQITERFHIQFRAEAFNLFNPNFGTVFPALVFKQNTFPRQLQPGIRA